MSVNVASGLKPGGIVIINTTKTAAQIRQEFKHQRHVLATVGATKIAMELLGVNHCQYYHDWSYHESDRSGQNGVLDRTHQ